MAKTAVIVEDDMVLSIINKRYLLKMGCEVLACVSNSEDAIESVRDLKPDFLLMDIRLDGSADGIETVSKIRSFSDVKVIYISGNSESAVKGCMDF
jgi:DNA-binding NarL/FixJ family response regulator